MSECLKYPEKHQLTIPKLPEDILCPS
jgi:hypothetical protein